MSKTMDNEIEKLEPLGSDALFGLFPLPWESEPSAQETQPARRTATIYAFDSTRVSKTRGEQAEPLARLIATAVNSHAATVNVIREIRASDCGAWMSDRPEGRQKRIEMMKLLDRLYKVAGIISEPNAEVSRGRATNESESE